MSQPSVSDQTTVIKLVFTGAITSTLIFAAGWSLLPAEVGLMTSASDRVTYTLRWQILTAFVLVYAVQRVGGLRFRTAAFDPIHGRGEHHLGVDARFLQNTLEQLIINIVGQLVLATFLGDNIQRVIPSLVAIFVLGRTVYFIGYKINPMYRAPGFAMTFLPCVFMYGYCMYCMVVYGPAYGIK